MRFTRHTFRLHLLGASLTLLVLAFHLAGLLAPLDRWMYDTRAKYFQFFTPPPTDRLLHVDIDDGSIDVIGRWPWKRSLMAGMIDELKRAGAGPVAIDLIFGQPDEPQIVADEFHVGHYQTIDHDAALAEAIARDGDVILPAALSIEPPPVRPAVYGWLVDALTDDLEQDDAALGARLVARGVPSPQAAADVDQFGRPAQREAMRQRVRRALDVLRENAGATDGAWLSARLFPRTPAGRGTDATRMFADVFSSILLERELTARLPPVPTGVVGLVRAEQLQPTVTSIARAAAGFGSVTFVKGADGTARNLPLLMRVGDRVVPHIALTLACRTLGVKVEQIEIGSDRLVLPGADGTRRVVPVRSIDSPQLGRVNYFFDLPVWGTDDWRTMYAPSPTRRTPAALMRGHLPAVKVWEAYDTVRSIERNVRRAWPALEKILDSRDQKLLARLRETKLDPHDAAATLNWIDQTLQTADPDLRAEAKDYFDGKSSLDSVASLDTAQREIARAMFTLETLAREIPLLQTKLADFRGELRKRVAGKSILLGWAATGEVDFYPTALHALAPGVVLIGTIFNGIVTGEMWRAAPRWASPVVALLLGSIMTLTIARLSSARWTTLAVLLGVGFVLVDALALFDYGNVLLDGATPLVTIAAVWAVGTAVRLALEASLRLRITRLFSSYVDPQLVDYFLASPDQVRLRGEVREMTVVFTDLAGFTSQMEQLGAATVPLLNEYMTRMVPVVRRRGGYLNKFLGDGLMFFFGAPRPNLAHAERAVATALDLVRETDALNDDLRTRGLPALAMRAGVSTGPMVVGDAGSEDACDYTVLGDAVNLGARLESANKYLGTRVLVSDVTARAAGDAFLFRPVGRLKIVGFDRPVECFEPLAGRADATDIDGQIAEKSLALVAAFVAGDLAACRRACEDLKGVGDRSKLSQIYGEVLQRGDGMPDDGVIVLESK